MSGSGYIEKFSLELSSMSVPERYEVWSDTFRRNFDVAFIGDSLAIHPPRVKGWFLNDVVMVESAFGHAVMNRGQQHINNYPQGLLCLEVRKTGVQQGKFGDRQSTKTSPGDVTILDHAMKYLRRSSVTSVANLLVSYSAVGYDPGRHPRIIQFPGQSATAYVLRNTILSLLNVLNHTKISEADSISRGLTSLVRGILFEDIKSGSQSFNTARSRAIRDYIERNIGHEKLSADVLCAVFQVSRATIYRDFKEDGGLERYIMARKLEAALDALSFGPKERGAVSRAAERWGFASTGHFSREFRRRFGFFPGEVVGVRPHAHRGDDFPASMRDEREMDHIASFLGRL